MAEVDALLDRLAREKDDAELDAGLHDEADDEPDDEPDDGGTADDAGTGR
jgi:hypothetical protein